MAEHSRFLAWLAIPPFLHTDFPPSKTIAIFCEFSEQFAGVKKELLSAQKVKQIEPIEPINLVNLRPLSEREQGDLVLG